MQASVAAGRLQLPRQCDHKNYRQRGTIGDAARLIVVADNNPDSKKHPLAPEDSDSMATGNDRTTVRVRGGVTTGAMRWVLGVGILLAVVALGLVWGMTATG